MRTCTIDDCEKKHLARGWCRMHYTRWRNTGSVEAVGPDLRTDLEKFMDQVWIVESGCWLWLGGVSSQGYGSFTPSTDRFFSAHRWSLEHFSGAIGTDDRVDHLCFVRSCVNPSHLRGSTPAENNSHRSGAQKNSKSGYRNVYETKGGRWAVRVFKDRITHSGGIFDDVDSALRSASDLRLSLFGEFAGQG